MSEERTLLVDASVFITLADTGSVDLLRTLDGRLRMPERVVQEITSEPASTELDDALGDWIHEKSSTLTRSLSDEWEQRFRTAANHLGRSTAPEDWGGDVPLLAISLHRDRPVVVTDDKPLRQTCKALSVPVTGSIGVLVHAVERGDIDASEAKSKLEAMDEVGARLSASLYRKAERMIEDAVEE